MEEEIDIIELFKRIKEGNAPKEIEINGKVYILTRYTCFLGVMYVEENNMSEYWELNNYAIDTIIKILDKPIIEELKMVKSMDGKVRAYPNEKTVFDKINEIIKHINKEGK